MPATIICSTWPTASPRRKIELAITAAALKSRLRQKLRQAVTPIARSAMPTSNWKGLTSQPMSAAAIWERKDERKRPEARTPTGKSRIHTKQAIGGGRACSAQPRKRQRRHEKEHRQVAQDEGDRSAIMDS